MTDELITPILVLLISRHSIVLLGLEKLITSQKPKMEVIRKFTHCAEVFSQGWYRVLKWNRWHDMFFSSCSLK